LQNQRKTQEINDAFDAPDTFKVRILKGVQANSLGQLIGVLIRFILPPLFLESWGVNLYGEWIILSSIAGYLMITDGGVQLYIINRLTQAYAKKQKELFASIAKTGLMMLIVIPMIGYTIFLIAILLEVPSLFIQLNEVQTEVIPIVLGIIGFEVLLSIPYGLLIGIYKSIGQLARGVMLANIHVLLQLIFVILALKLEAEIIAIAIVQIIPIIIIGIFAMRELSQKFIGLGLFHADAADLQLAKTFLKPSGYFFLIQFSQVAAIHGAVMIVGSLFTSVQVVIFATMRTISNSILQGVSIIAHTFWPELTKVDELNDQKSMYRYACIIIRTNFLMASVLVFLLHFFGKEIYHFWLGGDIKYNESVMSLFLVYTIQALYWKSCHYLLLATNKHHQLSIVLSINSFLTLFLAWIGGSNFGFEGVIIGIIISEISLLFWYIPYLIIKSWDVFTPIFFIKEIIVAGFCLIIGSAGIFWGLISIMLYFIWWYRCIPLNISILENIKKLFN